MTDPETSIHEFIRREFLYDATEMKVASDTMLLDEGILDSLRIFVLVPFLQQQFSVQIRTEDVTLRNFESIRAIGRLVERKATARES